MSDEVLSAKVDALRPLAEAVCARLAAEINKLALPPRESRYRPLFDLTTCHLETDPYSGESALIAVWLNGHGYRVGSLKFHGDGSFYAEFDVSEPHPGDARWFIESVTAWGKGEEIKSEAQLLAMPE